jgi:hypothetical protein
MLQYCSMVSGMSLHPKGFYTVNCNLGKINLGNCNLLTPESSFKGGNYKAVDLEGQI